MSKQIFTQKPNHTKPNWLDGLWLAGCVLVAALTLVFGAPASAPSPTSLMFAGSVIFTAITLYTLFSLAGKLRPVMILQGPELGARIHNVLTR